MMVVGGIVDEALLDVLLLLLVVVVSADAAAFFVAVVASGSDRCANSTPSSYPSVVLLVLTIEYSTSLRKPSLTRQYWKVAFIRKYTSEVSTSKYGIR